MGVMVTVALAMRRAAVAVATVGATAVATEGATVVDTEAATEVRLGTAVAVTEAAGPGEAAGTGRRPWG